MTNSSLTNNKRFWRWFGDSKVVDVNGDPLVVYHGTSGEFGQFRPSNTGEFGPGIYFTTSPSEASGYTGTNTRGANAGQNIIPVYLRLENPFIVQENPSEFWERFAASTDGESVAKAIAAGHDGVAFERPVQKWIDGKGVVDTGEIQTHYVAFSPTQVKSAIGNSGTFDLMSSDICDSHAKPEDTPVRDNCWPPVDDGFSL